MVNEANAIQTNMYPTSCVKHINPNVQTVADSIVECNVWFFLGHGDGSVREENYLLFVGDNGTCENGLQSMSPSDVVEMIQCARDMRLIVLNACSTSMLADAIIKECEHVNYVISWNTASHSEACEIFGIALAKYLKTESVPHAFRRAKLSMRLTQETGKMNGRPVGMSRFAEHDPDSSDVDEETGRIRSEHGLSPMAAGIPFLHKRGGPEV